jgi:hypothetical protein
VYINSVNRPMHRPNYTSGAGKGYFSLHLTALFLEFHLYIINCRVSGRASIVRTWSALILKRLVMFQPTRSSVTKPAVECLLTSPNSVLLHSLPAFGSLCPSICAGTVRLAHSFPSLGNIYGSFYSSLMYYDSVYCVLYARFGKYHGSQQLEHSVFPSSLSVFSVGGCDEFGCVEPFALRTAFRGW